MIDHGYAFNGPQWQFQDSPLQGLYFRTSVYQEVQSIESFQPWLDMVESFPVDVIDAAWKEIPREWLADDDTELERLLELLLRRRSRVPQLIAELKQKRAPAFQNWR